MSAYSQQRQATVPHGGSHVGLGAEADRRHVQEKRTAMVIVNRARDLLLLLMLLAPPERGLFIKKIVVPRQNPDEERGGSREF